MNLNTNVVILFICLGLGFFLMNTYQLEKDTFEYRMYELERKAAEEEKRRLEEEARNAELEKERERLDNLSIKDWTAQKEKERERTRQLAFEYGQKIIRKAKADSTSNQPLRIDLTSTGLTAFPKELGDVKHLVALNLSGNMIEGSVDLIGFRNLENLILTRKKVNRLYIGKNSCQQLRILDLSYNQITTISIESTLPNLKMLILKSNHLLEFPDVTKMPNVERIVLIDNNISSLPQGLLRLKSLKSLLILGNQLEGNYEYILKELKKKGVQVDVSFSK